MGNHVMHDCGAWMSKDDHVRFMRFVLFAVSEEAET